MYKEDRAYFSHSKHSYFLKTDQGGLAQGSKEGGPESSDNRSIGGN